MREAERPTEEHIEATAKHLKDLWEDARRKWVGTDGFIHGTYKVWDPPHDDPLTGRPAFRLARGRALVDIAADTQLPYEPRFHRDPLRESQAEKDRANAVENWVTAAWDEASRRETSNPAKAAVRYMVSYGHTVIEGPYKRLSTKPVREPEENDEEYEDRLSDWFPFRIRAQHPARVLLPPDEKRPTYAIKWVKQYGNHLAELTYTRKKARKEALVDVYDYGLEPWTAVDTMEYFSDRWHALMVAPQEGTKGRLLYIERNTDGFVPFAHAFSGWGQEPTEMDKIDPSYLAQGLLEPVKDSIKRGDQRLSARHTALMNASFAPLVTKNDPAEAAAGLAAGVVQGEEGDYSYVPQPQVGQWLADYGMEIDKDIETGTMSLMQAGFRQQGVERVGTTAILMNKSNLKFRGLTQQLEDMIAAVASNFLRLAARMETIPIISGHRLTQDDIGRRYHLRAELELVDPVLALQERELAMREHKERLTSNEGYWEVARVEDTTRRRRELYEDLVYQHPAVIQQGVIAAMKRLGMAELADRMEQEAKANAQAQANGAAGSRTEAPLPSEEPVEPGAPPTPASNLREMKKGLTNEVFSQPRVRTPPSARP